MSPILLLVFLISYFTVLVGLSYFTSRGEGSNADFFIANRNSSW
ncbi:MAG: hypothetical protein ACLFUB_16825 [Cyclobacteriaceae bacterium]